MKHEMLGLNSNPPTKNFGQKVGFFARLFGCWYFKLSCSTTIQNESYSVCVKCGARIKFDTEKLITVGSYYYPLNQTLYKEIQNAKTGGQN